ncbi:MAG: SRPBCC family protein [Jatrophihabitans sp.]
MSIVTVGAAGRLTVEEAWERYANIGLWSDWAPQLSRVEASGERLGFGVTGRLFGPFGAPVADFVVGAVDEDAHRWSWTVRRWPITLQLEHVVTKQGGGASTALRIEGPLPVIVGYAPIARFALQRLVSKQPRPTVKTEAVPAMYVDPDDDRPEGDAAPADPGRPSPGPGNRRG